VRTVYQEPPNRLQVAVKKSKGRTIFCFTLFLLYAFFTQAISKRGIEELSKQTFRKDLPGFQHTFESSNIGKWFELETALYLQRCLYEHVLGFSLEIRVCSSFTFPCSNADDDVDLRTTEYDVVTKRGDQCFLYEAKSGKVRFRDCKFQFEKERGMLLFFKEVYRELVKSVETQVQSITMDVKLSKRKLPKIIINGNVTDHNNISLMCTWVTAKTEEECLAQWINVLKIFSQGIFFLAFKKKVSSNFKEHLKRNNFLYIDNVSYQSKNDMYVSIVNLMQDISI